MKLVNINKITNNAFQKNQFNKTAHLALIICYCVFLLVKKSYHNVLPKQIYLVQAFNLKGLINVKKKNDINFFYIFFLITVLKVYLFFLFTLSGRARIADRKHIYAIIVCVILCDTADPNEIYTKIHIDQISDCLCNPSSCM